MLANGINAGSSNAREALVATATGNRLASASAQQIAQVSDDVVSVCQC